MADNTRVVLAPLIQLKVKDAAGSWVYRHYYAGAVLDLDEVEVDEDILRAHEESGQIVNEGERVAEVFAVPAGSPLPGKPPNVAPTESGDAANAGQPVPPLSANLLRAAEIDATGDEPFAAESTDRDEADRQRSADDRPRGNAGVEKWREYHVRRQVASGVPEEDARLEANSLEKDDLKARYQ